MTPQEAHEWIGVAVVAGLALALVLTALTGVAWLAACTWDTWMRDK